MIRVRQTRRSVGVTTAVLAVALGLVGCGSTSSGPAAGGSVTPEKHTITVYAASSLKDVFSLLGKNFSAAHPGTDVVFSFGASSTLGTQIAQGAPADVFASASKATMQAAITAGSLTSSQVFATNVLEVATPPDDPGKVSALGDLARAELKVAVCQPAVPCGAAATQLFAKAGLAVTPVSQEADVKAVLTKVELGEVDAGVVYVTDVLAAGSKVRGVPIPASANVSTSYPIGVVNASKEQAVAAEFVAFVLSPAGRAALGAAGFGGP